MYIGCNHVGRSYLGGIMSSYDREFTDQEVLIETGIADIVPCVMGDVSDAYKILKERISKLNSSDFSLVATEVFNTVCDYFGDYSNIDSRMDNYPDQDSIAYDHVEMGKVSNLKGQNSAMCVERAMLAQNLLINLGYKSYYKASEIIKNEKSEVHAYNLLDIGDKYYLFDATIPTEINGEMTPLITELPKEVFEEITSPLCKEGYSVLVEHYNPLRKEDVHITYDANRDKIYNNTINKIL